MNIGKFFLLFCIILIGLPTVFSLDGHMKLLAVSETSDLNFKGSVADLYIEILPGKGRVFIDTFPLAKLDTQISTRFARDIACDFLELDCSNLDFVYTIRANSAIIGGPSAGAAMASLTVATLEGLEFDDTKTITGTINSGSLIGPVGGVKEKIEAAAADEKIRAVLIPDGEMIFLKDNQTINLTEYAKNLSVNIVEVSDLNDAVFYFTGKRIKEDNGPIEISENYVKVMQDISVNLCNRSQNLLKLVNKYKNENNSLYIEGENLSTKGITAYLDNRFYSGASYCFGSNIKFRQLFLSNETVDNLIEELDVLREDIEEYQKILNEKEIKTILDLQTYMVVSERLADAKSYSSDVFIDLFSNNTDIATYNLAYAIERLNSAKTWALFFGKGGKEFVFDKASLEDSCMKKMLEAQERLQYVRLFFPVSQSGIKEDIDAGFEFAKEEDFIACLYKQSIAKAKADIILSSLGVDKDNVQDLIDKKLIKVEKDIVESATQGVFPILGYSYYEYSKSLRDENEYSSLLYSEYALELSNIDIYFKDSKKKLDLLETTNLHKLALYDYITAIVIGILIGMILTMLLQKNLKRKKKIRKLY